jgi:hypothetical protein
VRRRGGRHKATLLRSGEVGEGNRGSERGRGAKGLPALLAAGKAAGGEEGSSREVEKGVRLLLGLETLHTLWNRVFQLQPILLFSENLF